MKIFMITAGLILLIIAGCSRRYCQNKYPYDLRDSVEQSTTIGVDTAWYILPSDTTFIEVPFDCPDQQVIFKEGNKETKIVLKDKILRLYRVTPEDSLRILTLFKNTSEYKKRTVVKYVDVIKEVVPKWCWYLLAINVVVIIAFAIYLAIRLKNFFSRA